MRVVGIDSKNKVIYADLDHLAAMIDITITLENDPTETYSYSELSSYNFDDEDFIVNLGGTEITVFKGYENVIDSYELLKSLTLYTKCTIDTEYCGKGKYTFEVNTGRKVYIIADNYSKFGFLSVLAVRTTVMNHNN